MLDDDVDGCGEQTIWWYISYDVSYYWVVVSREYSKGWWWWLYKYNNDDKAL